MPGQTEGGGQARADGNHDDPLSNNTRFRHIENHSGVGYQNRTKGKRGLGEKIAKKDCKPRQL